MKLFSAIALALALASAGTQASPTPVEQDSAHHINLDAVNLYPIHPAGLTHSTPKRMPGYQNYLRDRHHDHSIEQLQRRSSSKVFSYIPDWASSLISCGIKWRQPKSAHKIKDPAYFTQQLDHFDHTTNVTFPQRFYYSLEYYVPSNKRKGEAVPVYIYDTGEASAHDYSSFLTTRGIIGVLAKETGGIGIILEHRYYGTSHPNRTDLGPGDTWGTDQLRWLNLRQSLEDSAEFIRNLNIPGIDNKEPRKFIYYGGSYPGARSAFMRVTYPDLVHGAIASSATVNSIDEYPEYFYPVARGSPANCSQAMQAAIADIDRIIAPDPELGSHQTRRNNTLTQQLLDLFELKNLTNPADFANLLTMPLGKFQELDWNPEYVSTEYADFCHTLTTYGADGKYPAKSKSAQLIAQGLNVSREAHAYAEFIRNQYVIPCLFDITSDSKKSSSSNLNSTTPVKTPDQCFQSSNDLALNATKLTDDISWIFQVCTEVGFIQMAPPIPKPIVNPVTGVKTYVQSGPKIVSSLLDYGFLHDDMCFKQFLPGQHYQVPKRPNVDMVNKYGGFNISHDRLAFIDGQYDPWRPATVHSEEFAYGGARPDTLNRPFKMIPDCWHVCDASGLKDPSKEPARIKAIHHQQIEFVKSWLK